MTFAKRNAAERRALERGAAIKADYPTPTTDRDELVVRLSGPHEWGYRCIADGAFIADDAPFQAAARIQSDAATIAAKDAALRNWDVQATVWLESRVPNAKPDWMLPAIKMGRAALKGGDHGIAAMGEGDVR